MSDETAKIDELKSRIAALKARYLQEFAPLLEELGMVEEESMRMQGLLDLDAEDEVMRDHLKALE